MRPASRSDEVGLRADARFDPEYGYGGQARSTYLYRRMRLRVVDWLRQTYGTPVTSRGN
jgi:hypothetical protein